MAADKEFLNAVKTVENGVLLDIFVRPNSKITGLTDYDKWRNRFEVKVRSPPKKGKANEELVVILSEFFKIKQSDVEIISGKKSVQKKVMLKSIDVETVISLLEAVIH